MYRALPEEGRDTSIEIEKNKGLGQLTKPIIDKLQNYFGIALRSNLSTVEHMRKAIFASFLHVAIPESNNYHAQCNILVSVSRGNLYKPGVGLSASVIKFVRHLYMALMYP